MPETKLVLQVVSLAAKILLQSGAEIYRVQETVERILEHYGCKEHEVYVLANGFFINVEKSEENASTSLRYVPLQGTNMGNIARVNQISRELCEDSCTLEQALEELEEIRNPQETREDIYRKRLTTCIMSGIGSGTFCYMFGGGWIDFLLSCALGMILQVVLYAASHTSRYLAFIFGAFVVTAVASWMKALCPGAGFDHLVIGGIFPLVPGVVFTTSINELFNGDHLSGGIHLLDAVMTGICMAVGVGAAIAVHNLFWG